MKIKALFAPTLNVRADMVGAYCPRGEKELSVLTKRLGISPVKDFSGKEDESILLYPEQRAARIVLAGLGDKAAATVETLRRATAAIAKKGAALHISSLTILFPSNVLAYANAPNAAATAIVEGLMLSLYKFDKYITKKNGANRITSVTVITDEKRLLDRISAGLERGIALCEGTIHARDLSNAPGNEIYPETLARDAQRLGRERKFTVTVFRRSRLRSLGMGGIIGVSSGSVKEPRFIIMEYGRAYKKNGTIALVGKGVTFDSGGISIKPSAGMAEMKMDMSGAAAVIGTFDAVSRLKIKRHLIGVIPSVENMPSGSSMKPGDIITHFNGKTSEVDNTDAEGRLILADALSYVGRYTPDVVVDLATLTGACVVALGAHATGMMGNDQPTMDALVRSGERTYERVWPLPLFDEYKRQIKSDVADVKNVGGRWAGAITAGMFLKHFIGDYKWVHLDIAGTAILEESQPYSPKGGSGVGVRLLADFIEHWND